jgi:hypothetical protein
MKSKIILLAAVAATAAAATITVLSGCGGGGNEYFQIDPGYDLFETTDSYMTINGQQITVVGVPLDSFDFGGDIGCVPTYQTDTIIKRLDGCTSEPNHNIMNLQIVALQVRCESPIDLGEYQGYIYVTLCDSPASTGTIEVDFDPFNEGGSFYSSFDLYFYVHMNSINGQIIPLDPPNLFTLKHFISTESPTWTREWPENSEWIQALFPNFEHPFIVNQVVHIAPGFKHTVHPPVWSQGGGGKR